MYLSHGEKEDLRLFSQRATELENSNAMKNCTRNPSVLLCLREEDGKPVNYDKNLPVEEDCEKFTRLIRQFILNNEKVNFNHICKILISRGIDVESVKKLKMCWKEILEPSQRQIGMFYRDALLSNSELIGIFLYGGHVHTKDALTIKKYEGFKEHMGEFFDFWIFNVMYDLADIVIRAKRIVNKAV